MSKTYQTTREVCQSKIDKADGVCPGCGGLVTPIETVDNSGNPTYWSGCEVCQVFTHPVDKRLYHTAQKLIDDNEYRYNPKPYNASDDELAYWRSSESRGLCSRIAHYVRAYEEQP